MENKESSVTNWQIYNRKEPCKLCKKKEARDKRSVYGICRKCYFKIEKSDAEMRKKKRELAKFTRWAAKPFKKTNSIQKLKAFVFFTERKKMRDRMFRDLLLNEVSLLKKEKKQQQEKEASLLNRISLLEKQLNHSKKNSP